MLKNLSKICSVIWLSSVATFASDIDSDQMEQRRQDARLRIVSTKSIGELQTLQDQLADEFKVRNLRNNLSFLSKN